MKLNLSLSGVALSLAIAISGCSPQMQALHTPGPVEPTMFVFGPDATTQPPEEVNAIIADEARLRGALQRLRVATTPAPAPLGDFIALIRSENQAANGLPAFSGLGGGYAHALLAAAERKVGSNDDFDPNKTSVVVLSGRIMDYTYDPDQKSGTLVVETTAIATSGTDTEIHTYMWTIEIRPNGYRDVFHSGDDDDPFLDTLKFDQTMLDRIEDEEFNRKLYVRGAAGKIRITSIVRDGLPVPSGDPLLRPSPQNCIDLMFRIIPQDGLLPTTFAELQDYSYCLGRCKNPAIINTR